MLAALAVDWVFVLCRAVLAILFGCVVVMWPAPTLRTLVWLFACYSAADGILALIVAFDVRGLPGFGGLLAEALARMSVAVAAVSSPAFVALVLPRVFAASAVLYGLAAIATALALGRELVGEWPLPLAGAFSIVVGAMVLLGLASPDLAWVMGPYSVIYGATLLALTRRLQQLAAELAVSS